MRLFLRIATLLCFVLFACLTAHAQQYLKSNEKLVMSFNTANGKRMVLAVDTANKYLVYRYGTRKRVELEYPADMDNSFKKLRLFHYMRGGGVQNDAEDLKQLQFTINGVTYKLYDNWYAVGNRSECGIVIPGTRMAHTVTIKAIARTKKGGLESLIDNEAIPSANEDDK